MSMNLKDKEGVEGCVCVCVCVCVFQVERNACVKAWRPWMSEHVLRNE